MMKLPTFAVLSMLSIGVEATAHIAGPAMHGLLECLEDADDSTLRDPLPSHRRCCGGMHD